MSTTRRSATRKPRSSSTRTPTTRRTPRAGAKAALTRARSAAWLARTRGRPDDAGGLRILLYHRVADDGDPLSVPPRQFVRQMDFVAREGYQVLDLTAALRRLEAGIERVVGLTFDDAFADVRDAALPVLERHGFTATVFVTTAVTDGRAAFPWYRAAQPPVLGWADVVRLDREGTLRFEAHTVTHPNLLSLDEPAAAAEIAGSRTELEQRLQRPVTAFAYPAGLYGERERRLVAAAGFEAAATCEPGLNRPDTDRLLLHRRQVDPRDALLDFRAKLGGGHDRPLPLRALYRSRRFGMRAS